MKVYIAGKITSDKNYQQKFAQAQAHLKAQGYTVLNPAVLPEGMSAVDYMKICFAMIDCADVVMFLPDWKESKGASLEKSYCEYIGKPIWYWSVTDTDFIFNMTNEELAEWVHKRFGCPLNNIDDCKKCVCNEQECVYSCIKSHLQNWLRQPINYGGKK